jgi:hypothetical protein
VNTIWPWKVVRQDNSRVMLREHNQVIGEVESLRDRLSARPDSTRSMLAERAMLVEIARLRKQNARLRAAR